jgi:hypothetical protein
MTDKHAPTMREALKTAIGHIERMAAFITANTSGYSFESLGEDMPGMRAALEAGSPGVGQPVERCEIPANGKFDQPACHQSVTYGDLNAGHLVHEHANVIDGIKSGVETTKNFPLGCGQDAKHGASLAHSTGPAPALAAPGEPVAFVPIHPKNGPLWGETYPASADVSENRPKHYATKALYDHASPRALDVEEVARRYRDCFAEITAKAVPIEFDPKDSERITAYRIPCGPLHRAAGKVEGQMFNGEQHIRDAVARIRELEQQLSQVTEQIADQLDCSCTENAPCDNSSNCRGWWAEQVRKMNAAALAKGSK